MSQQAPRPAPQAVDDELPRLLREAIASIDRILAGGDEHPGADAGFTRSYRGQLAILRALLGAERPLLVPELDHLAPLGWAYPTVERELELESGRGVDPLEGLADLGLLQRELHSHVQVCPRCHHFHVNYRESCVGCTSIDIEVERLIHHFHCAYVGLESEFQQGVDLYCPRCRRRLFQLGQDFEWPHDTYVCRDCQRIFEDPYLHAQCVFCAHEFAARDTELVKVWRYAPTPLAVRAVELNRLTGLDVSQIMYDARVRLATPDFLRLEIQREVQRLARYGGQFSVGLLAFRRVESEYPVFREWSVETVREFSSILTRTLRPLDLVARLGVARIGLFLPETDAAGAATVERRLGGLLQESTFTTRSGHALEPAWRWGTWAGYTVEPAEVAAFLELGEDVA